VSATETVPPQDDRMERAVLGSLLVTESALPTVIDEVGLAAGDFYLDKHAAIFRCISDLYAAGKPTDELSVTAALTGDQRKRITNGNSDPDHFLAELAASVPAAGNAKHYATVVKAHSGSREIIAVAHGAIEAAQSGSLDGAPALAEKLAMAGTNTAGEITTVKGSEIRLRAVRFLDSAGMIPLRSITVAFGPAGLGKTVYGLAVCAKVTAGSMDGLDDPAPVLISSQEDDAEAVLAPRLIAAGADMERVHFVSGLSLPSQVPALRARAKTLGARLVLIDPIAAHLDSAIDSHKDAGVRTALAPLAEMATELDSSVLVICHPNKATSSTGLNRLSGSGAFGNAPRSVIVFGLDPADPDGEAGNQRIIGHLKCNVGKKAPSISAELVSKIVDTEDGSAAVPTLRINGLSNVSGEEVLSAPTGEERTERDEARQFLEGILSNNRVRTKEIEAAAKSAGHHWRTVERAKKELGIKPERESDGWYWSLPEGGA
jgi:putative DNA primase/helicase